MRGLPQLQLIARRGLATKAVKAKPAGVYPAAEGYKHIQQLQNVFTKEDGLLVWQKRGATDTVMYNISMGIMLLGCIPAALVIYKLSFPQKK
ncbi:hypothetical protein SNE40_011146 [Patella caerulea]|uniref:Uncharacterized protein n=1 Tax=Patella caerulea TaxID=87958 RepID=A0AAN8JTR3_PATCE